MDAYARKKAIGGPGSFVRGGKNLTFRDPNRDDRQNCNRLGCATRLNSITGSQTARPDKSKHSSTSTCSKALAVGSSSSISNHAINDQWQGGESRKNRGQMVNLHSSGLSKVSSSRLYKPRNQNSSREISLSSSLKCPVTSGSTTSKASKHVAHNNLRNLGSNFVSEVLPDRGIRNRRVDSVKKRLYESETSSSRAKSITATSLSSSEGSLQIQASRKVKTQPVRSQPAVSDRRRKSKNGDTRVRSPAQNDDNTPSLASTSEAASESSSRSVRVELPPAFHESLGRPSSTTRARRNRTAPRIEDRHLNIESIAEVLLALERIEQDEELSYEQQLVIETNLILGRRSFYDQHYNMRMDIDNMTYEELLALEENMGTVSTALSEEAIAKCLWRSIYMSNFLVPGHSNKENEDTKCSICQEEYASGDEVGELTCEHLFHVECVHQWLRLKSWCPICKASAGASNK